MTTVELLALYRSQMRDDVDNPYLWSDEEVYGYMGDAQSMFCRLTDGITDATTTSVTRVSIAIGDTSARMHKAILKIRSATLLSTGEPIEILNVEDMAARGMRFDGRTGPTKALIEGMEEDKVFFYPVPNIADTVVLTVFRLPLHEISESNCDVEFEINRQHHRHLLSWMAHLGYEKQDAETFDKTKAREFEEKFRNYCAMALAEQRNKRHKVRSVGYGGIPMSGSCMPPRSW